MIFYCGLVAHITDTRAQKVVSYTSAHIAETVFAHDQHWEEQSCLSSPQLYRHSQKHRKMDKPYRRALHNRCQYVSSLERSKELSQHFLLFMLGVYTMSTYFCYTKAILMRRKLPNNSQTTTAFGLHTGVLNN